MRLADIFIVQMPENLSRWKPVRKIERDSSNGAVQLAWDVDRTAAFWVDEFHESIILAVLRRAWSIFGMVLPVIPFHRRGKDEGLHAVHNLVIWARFTFHRLSRQHEQILRLASGPGQMPGERADLCLDVVHIDRLQEPAVSGIFIVKFL